MKWQMASNGVYVLVYVVLSLVLLGSYGLNGFCVGTLVATTMKLLFTLFIYHHCKEKTEL